MKFEPSDTFTEIWKIESQRHSDGRGGFSRTFCQQEFDTQGISFKPTQWSHSFNIKSGTLRGLHFQKRPFMEQKLVSCIAGEIFDVVVDIRKESNTFGRWESFVLNDRNNISIYIPKGFAHGFQTMSPNAVVSYCISPEYSPEHSAGMCWNDVELGITWPSSPSDRIISERDLALPPLSSIFQKSK